MAMEPVIAIPHGETDSTSSAERDRVSPDMPDTGDIKPLPLSGSILCPVPSTNSLGSAHDPYSYGYPATPYTPLSIRTDSAVDPALTTPLYLSAEIPSTSPVHSHCACANCYYANISPSHTHHVEPLTTSASFSQLTKPLSPLVPLPVTNTFGGHHAAQSLSMSPQAQIFYPQHVLSEVDVDAFLSILRHRFPVWSMQDAVEQANVLRQLGLTTEEDRALAYLESHVVASHMQSELLMSQAPQPDEHHPTNLSMDTHSKASALDMSTYSSTQLNTSADDSQGVIDTVNFEGAMYTHGDLFASETSPIDPFVVTAVTRHRKMDFLCSIPVKVGDFVCVEGDRGTDIFRVHFMYRHDSGHTKAALAAKSSGEGGRSNSNRQLKAVVRLATPAEIIAVTQDQPIQESHALEFCRKQVAILDLPITVDWCEFQADRKKVIFNYSAPQRVMFNELVNVLHQRFRCRIWMEWTSHSGVAFHPPGAPERQIVNALAQDSQHASLGFQLRNGAGGSRHSDRDRQRARGRRQQTTA